MEVKAEEQASYNQALADKSHSSPFESGCHSWYINADGRNTNNWVGYMSEYGQTIKKPQYEHFQLS